MSDSDSIDASFSYDSKDERRRPSILRRNTVHDSVKAVYGEDEKAKIDVEIVKVSNIRFTRAPRRYFSYISKPNTHTHTHTYTHTNIHTHTANDTSESSIHETITQYAKRLQ